MAYAKQLPHLRDLLELSHRVSFPADRRLIESRAEGLDDVADFLEQFPPGEVFSSRVDFMTRCEELEMLINQERSTPEETLRSPQD